MAGDKFYSTKDWYRLRELAKKRDRYYCRICGAYCRGKSMAHVDHIISRRKAPQLERDINNLQTLCTHCHNSIKQRDERNPNRGCNDEGYPVDGSWD